MALSRIGRIQVPGEDATENGRPILRALFAAQLVHRVAAQQIVELVTVLRHLLQQMGADQCVQGVTGVPAVEPVEPGERRHRLAAELGTRMQGEPPEQPGRLLRQRPPTLTSSGAFGKSLSTASSCRSSPIRLTNPAMSPGSCRGSGSRPPGRWKWIPPLTSRA